MTAQEKITFCRLCEQMCGLRVTVDNGVVTRIRADREHPLTRGFACPKGLAANEIQYDPARVTTPLRRTASGGFEPVTWSAALHEIGTRLRGVIDRYGPESIGMYQGNPAAYSIGHYFFAKGMMDALGSPHFYSPASQDTSSRFAASYFLYGSPVSVPIPDLPRTDFLLMVGANPFVSHGSLMQGVWFESTCRRSWSVAAGWSSSIHAAPRQPNASSMSPSCPTVTRGCCWRC